MKLSLVSLLSCLCMASNGVSVRIFGIHTVLTTCQPNRVYLCWLIHRLHLFWLCGLQYICRVAVQGVNGHSRKVTVWGRKDSIVYRHSPCSWRWTTMVSFISPYSVDTRSEGFIQDEASSQKKILCKMCTVYFPSVWGFVLGLTCLISLLFPKATRFGICIGSSRGKSIYLSIFALYVCRKRCMYPCALVRCSMHCPC